MTFANENDVQQTGPPDIPASTQNDAEPATGRASRSLANDAEDRRWGVAADPQRETEKQRRRGQAEGSGSATGSSTSLVLTNGLHGESEPGEERDFDGKEQTEAENQSSPSTGSPALEERASAKKLLFCKTSGGAELLDPEDGDEQLR